MLGFPAVGSRAFAGAPSEHAGRERGRPHIETLRVLRHVPVGRLAGPLVLGIALLAL